jgi:hypothetical protein
MAAKWAALVAWFVCRAKFAGGVSPSLRRQPKRKALLRKEKAMVTVKIKDGTPEGAASLCASCRWAHIVKGFADSQQVTHCTWLRPSMLVRFPVSQCNCYDDRRIPSRYDMEKIAWILLTKKAGRSIGFVTAKQFREIEGEDAEIIPAAQVQQIETGE